MTKHKWIGLLCLLLAVGCGGATDSTTPGDDGPGDDQAGGDVPSPDGIFRMTSLALRDPHAFVTLIGCTDVTDTPVTGLNALFQGALTQNDGAGGFVNNLLLRFRPLDPGTPGGAIDVVQGATCTVVNTTCTVPGTSIVTPFTDANGRQVGTCLEPGAGTLRPYAPAVVAPGGPCFATAPEDFGLDLAGIQLGLESVQIGGRYVGDPVTEIVDGLLMGFLPEATALATTLPDAFPVIGGQTIASLFPGGLGACDGGDDRDVGPDGVTVGWWVYFAFTAVKVEVQ